MLKSMQWHIYADFMHIYCIFTAYVMHIYAYYIFIEHIYAYDFMQIIYVEVYVMAYFVHILACKCILNAYSSSAGPRDGPVPGCSDSVRVPLSS